MVVTQGGIEPLRGRSVGRRPLMEYWTYFSVNGVQLRRPLCPPGSTLPTTNRQEATRLEKEMIRAALAGELAPRDPSVKLFAAVDDYLEAKKATANSERTIEFDRERLEIVKRHLGDVKLSIVTRKVIEGFQAKRRLEGASNRTINMDVGALRQVLKRFKQWRRLEDDVKMLTEAGGVPVGRALTPEEQKRLFEAAASNPEWAHVYCAAVLAANTDAPRRGKARAAPGCRPRKGVGCRERDGQGRALCNSQQERNEQAADPAEPGRARRG